MKTTLSIALGALALLLFAPPTHAGEPGGSDLDRLASLTTGSFSSKPQSERDPEFKDVRLHIVPVWQDRAGEHWLYVEQAIADSVDKPYRQRVYQLLDKGDGKLASVVYELPGDPLKYANDWKKPQPLSDIGPADLKSRGGCVVIMARQADGTFNGSTAEKSCESKLRGASWATSQVTITPASMTTWDRGYDAEGKQVWGATKGPYVFTRVKE